MTARVSSLILRSSRVIAWRMFRSFFSLPGVTTTWRKLLAHLGILVQLNISSIVFQFWSSFCSIVESPSSELVFLLKSSNSCEPEELFVNYFPNNWHTATTLETRPVKSSDWVWLLSFKCLYTNMKLFVSGHISEIDSVDRRPRIHDVQCGTMCICFSLSVSGLSLYKAPEFPRYCKTSPSNRPPCPNAPCRVTS